MHNYNLGTLLRRLALPLTIQSWSLTSFQQRLFKTGGRLIRHARYFILQLAESPCRKPLDQDPLLADPRAHRATRVAPHVIESPTAGAGADEQQGSKQLRCL
jgi:hypothetical protein